jgi:TPR repeat protein
VKAEYKQQTAAADQFPPPPEQPATAREGQPTNELAQVSNLSGDKQVDVAIKFRLMGRYGDEEKALRNPQSVEAKAYRALAIQEDTEQFRESGQTTFDRSEAEKLAKEALPKLKEDANNRSLSMYLLGGLYNAGLGVPKDLHEAFRLTSEAASKGEILAFCRLASEYHYGDGVEKNEAFALEWARKGADAGDTEQMLIVSSAYEEGTVFKRSLASAMYYLEKAARAGNPEAMRRYSGRLNLGPSAGLSLDTFKRMREEASDWLVKAAEAGNVWAMSAMSINYEVGRVLPPHVGRDWKKAFEWRKRAAASGLPLAIACLSRYYRFGIGCEKNEDLADSLLDQAKKAAKGDEKTVVLLESQSKSNPIAVSESPGQPESSEPVADQSPKEATSKPHRGQNPEEAKPPAKPDDQRLTIAIVEQTGGHTKFGGMLPNYEVVAIVRNTSSQPLKMLTMTVLLRRADNSLIGTESRSGDVRNLEPGDTCTIKMDTGESLDEIDHYDLRFTAGFPDEKNVEFTLEQSNRPPAKAKAATRQSRH